MSAAKFVVQREKWLRGEGATESALLRSDGKMCCVGFFALQVVGLTPDDIIHEPVLGTREPWGVKIDGCHIYDTNDDSLMDDVDRETRLRAEFAKIDVEVVFE